MSTGVGPVPLRVTATLSGYELYTHCGITHVVVCDKYDEATPSLSDGHGNPAAGWGNPFQKGTLTEYPDGLAVFTSGLLRADFVLTDRQPSDAPNCA